MPSYRSTIYASPAVVAALLASGAMKRGRGKGRRYTCGVCELRRHNGALIWMKDSGQVGAHIRNQHPDRYADARED